MTRLARKLREKLVAAGVELPERIVIRRLYPGHWQRSDGAWVWHLVKCNGDALLFRGGLIGSQFTATECANAPKVMCSFGFGGDLDVYPAEEGQKERKLSIREGPTRPLW